MTTNSYMTLGIDGGGTGCRVAIADATGTILGSATGGPANYTSEPTQTAFNLSLAIQDALHSAQLTTKHLANCSAHIGLAGIMSERDSHNLSSALPSFAKITVSDDRITSVTGALGNNKGALISIGTGTIVGIQKDDSIKFFGGWGLQVSDQASGAWLGRKLLEQCLLVYDGLMPTSELTTNTLRRFGKDPVQIVSFATQARPADYATFAPKIIEAASAGDENGLMLMKQGANYLNSCLHSSSITGEFMICLSGGVGPSYEPYLEPGFANRLQPSKGTALDGALQLAKSAIDPQSKSI